MTMAGMKRRHYVEPHPAKVEFWEKKMSRDGGLLWKIYQAGARDGFPMNKRDPLTDSLARDGMIECRRSDNTTETWWLTDKGKKCLGVSKE